MALHSWFRGKDFRYKVALVCLLGFVVRLVYVTLIHNFRHPDLNFDSTWYHLQAVLIAQGHGFIDPHYWYQGKSPRAAFQLAHIDLAHPARVSLPTLQFPPLFPAVLSLVALVFHTSLLAQQIECCVIGTVTVLLITLLGRRVSGSETVALIAGCIAALDPMLFQPDGGVLSESLYGALAAGLLLAAYRVIDGPTWGRWAMVGLLGGAAALARGEGTFLLVFVLAATAWALWPVLRRQQLKGVALAGLVFVAVITPWVVRNSELMGRPTFLSDDIDVTFAGANCPSTYYGSEIGEWDYRCVDALAPKLKEETAANERTAEAQNNKVYKDAATSYVSHHLDRVALVMAARALRTWDLYWNPKEQVVIEAVDGRTVAFEAFGQLLSVVLLPFAVFGILQLRRRKRTVWPMVAAVITVTLVSIVLHGGSRLRISADPAIIVCAAFGIVAVFRSQSAKVSSRLGRRPQPDLASDGELSVEPSLDTPDIRAHFRVAAADADLT